MSDSDDDGAFASADEGEPGVVPQKESKKGAPDKKASNEAEKVKEAKVAAKPKASAAARTKEEQPAKATSRKEQKKKGKGGSKPSQQKAGKKQEPVTGENPSPPTSGNGDKVQAAGDKDSEQKQATKPGDKDDKKTGDPVEESKPGETKEKTEDRPAVPAAEGGVPADVISTEKPTEQSDKPTVATETERDASPEKVDKPVEREASPQKEASEPVPQPGLVKVPSSQDIPRSKPDHTPQQEQVLAGLAEAAAEKSEGGWGWGSWGSSLLDVASSSVTTFTHQVGEGLNTMMETVESTLNVPSPEELLKQQREADKVTGDEVVEEEPRSAPPPDSKGEGEASRSGDGPADPGDSGTEGSEASSAETSKKGPEAGDQAGGWFSSWGVSNITNIVQNTSKKLVTGSLDVLETVGKKTFDVIKDHDPGLRKTRGLLFERGDKPNLSHMLRDAKEQSEMRAQQEVESEEARKAHFGTLFDEYQGLSHLEALEILCNQSERQVGSLLTALPPDVIAKIKPQLLTIKEQFELNEDEEEEEDGEKEHDFISLTTDLLARLQLPLSPNKLNTTQGKIRKSIDDFSPQTEEDSQQAKATHQMAIRALAEMTSKSIENFHKVGELVLVPADSRKDCVQISRELASLTRVLCTEIGILSTKFSSCLNACSKEDSSAINSMVTNVYLEATNSSSYIQDGFQLLLPVLQQVALEQTQTPGQDS